MADLSSLYQPMTDEQSVSEAEAIRRALRRDKTMAILGAITGDPVIGGVSQLLNESASQGEKELQAYGQQRLKSQLEHEQWQAQFDKATTLQEKQAAAARAHDVLLTERAEKLAALTHKRALDLEKLRQEAENWMPFKGEDDEPLLVNKKTGEVKSGTLAGQPTQQPMGPYDLKGLKLNEQQTKAHDIVGRIIKAFPSMAAAGVPEGIWGRKDAWAAGAMGGAPAYIIPREWSSKEGQQYFAAARDVIAALLRKESGAQVTPSEWNEFGPLYIPMPTDTPDVKADKMDRLANRLILGIQQSGPKAAKMYREQAVQILDNMKKMTAELRGGGGTVEHRQREKKKGTLPAWATGLPASTGRGPAVPVTDPTQAGLPAATAPYFLRAPGIPEQQGPSARQRANELLGGQ